MGRYPYEVMAFPDFFVEDPETIASEEAFNKLESREEQSERSHMRNPDRTAERAAEKSGMDFLVHPWQLKTAIQVKTVGALAFRGAEQAGSQPANQPAESSTAA